MMKLIALFALIALAFAQNNTLGPRKCQSVPTSAACTTYKDVGVAVGDQCGLCYQGLTGSQANLGTSLENQNLYCSQGSRCQLVTGGTYRTCVAVTILARGDSCDPTSSTQICSDNKYVPSCLPVEKRCGAAFVYDAGMSCAQSVDNDLTGSPYFGCIQNQCVGGKCNTTSTGCSPGAQGSTGVPPLPTQYCNLLVSPSVAVSRIAVGGDCTNSSALNPCVWNAACVSDGNTPAKRTCVAYGSATVGQPCTANGICTGDLACGVSSGKLQCLVPSSVGAACTITSASQCDSTSFTSSCACDYTNGQASCQGANWGVARTNAWVKYTTCVQNNDCSLFSYPYYGSCVDQNCYAQAKAFYCAKGISTIKALKTDNTGAKNPCGSSASSVALAMAASFAAVVAMLLA